MPKWESNIKMDLQEVVWGAMSKVGYGTPSLNWRVILRWIFRKWFGVLCLK